MPVSEHVVSSHFVTVVWTQMATGRRVHSHKAVGTFRLALWMRQGVDDLRLTCCTPLCFVLMRWALRRHLFWYLPLFLRAETQLCFERMLNGQTAAAPRPGRKWS